jgi:hypothetical protein
VVAKWEARREVSRGGLLSLWGQAWRTSTVPGLISSSYPASADLHFRISTDAAQVGSPSPKRAEVFSISFEVWRAQKRALLTTSSQDPAILYPWAEHSCLLSEDAEATREGQPEGPPMHHKHAQDALHLSLQA